MATTYMEFAPPADAESKDESKKAGIFHGPPGSVTFLQIVSVMRTLLYLGGMILFIIYAAGTKNDDDYIVVRLHDTDVLVSVTGETKAWADQPTLGYRPNIALAVIYGIAAAWAAFRTYVHFKTDDVFYESDNVRSGRDLQWDVYIPGGLDFLAYGFAVQTIVRQTQLTTFVHLIFMFVAIQILGGLYVHYAIHGRRESKWYFMELVVLGTIILSLIVWVFVFFAQWSFRNHRKYTPTANAYLIVMLAYLAAVCFWGFLFSFSTFRYWLHMYVDGMVKRPPRLFVYLVPMVLQVAVGFALFVLALIEFRK